MKYWNYIDLQSWMITNKIHIWLRFGIFHSFYGILYLFFFPEILCWSYEKIKFQYDTFSPLFNFIGVCSLILFRLDESMSLKKLGLSDACLATLASEG